MREKTEEKIRKLIKFSQKRLEQSQKDADNEGFCTDTRMLFAGKTIAYSAIIPILQSILEEGADE